MLRIVASRCRRGATTLACLALVVGGSPSAEGAPPVSAWEPLEMGLEYASFVAPQLSTLGDSRIRVLRADPRRFRLRLLNASSPAYGSALTAKQWALREDLVAAVNASMYQTDGSTSVSLMIAPGHVNNRRLSKDQTILAFDALEPGLPPVRIVDRTCDDFETLRSRYGTLVQSIRMISCRGRNVWKQQSKKWSIAAIAMDGRGRILLIHVRSPYSTHDLIENLRGLPLDVRRAMYLEGGGPAQLYIRSSGREIDLVGSQGSLGVGGNLIAVPLPNVLGLERID